jgi:hypothetical protein
MSEEHNYLLTDRRAEITRMRGLENRHHGPRYYGYKAQGRQEKMTTQQAAGVFEISNPGGGAHGMSAPPKPCAIKHLRSSATSRASSRLEHSAALRILSLSPSRDCIITT